MKKLLMSAIILGLLVGCGSKGSVKDSAAGGRGAGAAVEERSAGAAGDAANGGRAVPGKIAAAGPLEGAAGASGDAPGGVFPAKDVAGPLSQRSIFFDFDSYDVKPEFRPAVEAHAKFLLDHPNAKVNIQGNTDERGSREYNLGLGQRRADAVRKRMNVLGVPDTQIETISFGEEKPRNPGHDEDAWKENRRVDIVYKGE
jgi:peptidoglycan-associated lipoprotein